MAIKGTPAQVTKITQALVRNNWCNAQVAMMYGSKELARVLDAAEHIMKPYKRQRRTKRWEADR